MAEGHLTKYFIYCMCVFEPEDLVIFSEDPGKKKLLTATVCAV